MTKRALVVGITGIQGGALADRLIADGYQVFGLARRPGTRPGVTSVAADLLDPASLSAALDGIAPTHVFVAAWLRMESEAENIRVNALMLRNLFAALRPRRSVRHVALATGLKHYLGPFEAYGRGTLPQTPFREEQDRLEVENFYYAQEDELFAAARQDGFAWTVHRPHTVIGAALGNAMNMGQTLAVHASICKETGRPFRFPGSRVQWESLTDMTDARQLAAQMAWAAADPRVQDQAYNIVNGDVFRWSWMWFRIAEWFGIEAEAFDGTVRPLEEQMAGDAETWAGIASRHGLAEPDFARLASPWHTDADLGRPIEVVTDMSKSRRFGFNDYIATDEAFFDLFARLRTERLIPAA